MIDATLRPVQTLRPESTSSAPSQWCVGVEHFPPGTSRPSQPAGGTRRGYLFLLMTLDSRLRYGRNSSRRWISACGCQLLFTRRPTGKPSASTKLLRRTIDPLSISKKTTGSSCYQWPNSLTTIRTHRQPESRPSMGISDSTPRR